MSKANELQIANEFNKFFIDSVTDIHECIENSAFDVNSVKICPNDLESRTIKQLYEVVKNMKDKKDFDGVVIRFVLDSWDYIGETLLDIVNRSLREGFWLLETIDGSCCGKLSKKIMESVVKHQLLQHIFPNDILIGEKTGYRKSHSCETALN